MKKKKNNWIHLKFDSYAFCILLAVELIMSFTFLGYIHIPPISVTTAHIPIIVAGCLFGPVESTITGLIFGLGSLFKASAFYVMPNDGIFSPFQSDSPFGSIMLSVGTRVLFGLIIGCLFALAKRTKHVRIWNGLISMIATGLHALFVYAAIGIFFPEIGYTYKSAIHLKWNDVIVMALYLVCVELLYAFYHSKPVQRYKTAINEAANTPFFSSRIWLLLGVVTAFIVCMASFATVYFSSRAKYMLGEHGVKVTSEISSDLLHLQVQFLIAMIALNMILIILILLVYKYMKYKEYQGEMDALTGVMGRRLFLQYCTKLQQKKPAQSHGWFLFLDVDKFKQINDTLGHLVGDEILKQVAGILQNTFGEFGAVGRMGGDEFAVIIEQEMSKEILAQKLNGFLKEISDISSELLVSCSIGAYHFEFPKEIKHLLGETDRILYQAKENGRTCFVIQE